MSQNELEELNGNPQLEKLRGELLIKIYEKVGILFADESIKSLLVIYRELQNKNK